MARQHMDESQSKNYLGAFDPGQTRSICPDECKNDDFSFGVRDHQIGTVIDGKYLLRNHLGCGGVGEVWNAEQLVPVKRQVAIKLLRAHALSQIGITRFAFEHQALALMNHSYIANVYDGGFNANRTPYIVMEFVNGSQLTDICKEKLLDLCDQLLLFTKVCRAVEHAHQRGIIHRDLKPSNILVVEEAGELIPKVIDFGLAKSMPWSDFGEMLAKTRSGTALGSPAYMSPEQIRGSEEVDVRTDVYALGCVLYELVCGTPPFSLQADQAECWVEVFQAVLHELPIKPSIVLRREIPSTPLPSSNALDWPKSCRRIANELDWIILKCLEKDAHCRYQSVEMLRSDLERFLNDQPVLAKPKSRIYLAHKFLKRHTRVAVAGAILFAAGIASVASMALSAKFSRDAELRANSAVKAELEAKTQRLDAIAALASSLSYVALTSNQEDPKLLECVVQLHDIATSGNSTHNHLFDREIAAHGPNYEQQLLMRILCVVEQLREERPDIALSEVESRLKQRLESNDVRSSTLKKSSGFR